VQRQRLSIGQRFLCVELLDRLELGQARKNCRRYWSFSAAVGPRVPWGTDPPRAESGGVVVRVHLARADGHSKPGRAPIQFWRRRAEVTKATRRCGRVYGVVVSALAAAPRQQKPWPSERALRKG